MDLAHQAPLSVGSSRQEYWSGLPFPSPGDRPEPRIEPACQIPYRSATGQAWPFHSEARLEVEGRLGQHPPQPPGHHDGHTVAHGLRLGRGVRGQQGAPRPVSNGCPDRLPE